MKLFSKRFSGVGFTIATICTLFIMTAAHGQRQQYQSSEFIRNADIKMDAKGLSPTYMKFREGNQPTALIFFREYKKSFPEFSSSDNEVRMLRFIKDQLGETHYRYDQYYKGIQVFGARSSELITLDKHVVQIHEHSCTDKRYLLILQVPKLTYEKNKNLYSDILTTFSINC